MQILHTNGISKPALQSTMFKLGYFFDDMVIYCKFKGLQCQNGVRLIGEPVISADVDVAKTRSGIAEGLQLTLTIDEKEFTGSSED
uniref:Uncharacterized protein n=1 Tax=Romanomermis culicivorax TaxID=13658 RepID=A0A915ICW0_ROMCU